MQFAAADRRWDATFCCERQTRRLPYLLVCDVWHAQQLNCSKHNPVEQVLLQLRASSKARCDSSSSSSVPFCVPALQRQWSLADISHETQAQSLKHNRKAVQHRLTPLHGHQKKLATWHCGGVAAALLQRAPAHSGVGV